MHLKILCVLLVACTCAEIPKSLKKCDRKAKNFKECLTAAVEDALTKSSAPVQEIGLQKLDPLEIPVLTVGAGKGAVGFDQNYKNLKISGFSKTKCSKADFSFADKTLTVDCDFPSILWQFQVNINGTILSLPVYGTGPGSLEFVRMNVKPTFTLQEYEKKGKKHYKVTSNKLVLTPQLVKFRVDNLFDGDKPRGDKINKAMNDNWSEVFGDVKTNYEQVFAKFFSNIFDQVLEKVSVSELFGDA